MAKFDDKVNGNTVAADEYNNIVRASKNAIEDSGQTIDATNTQLSEAVANYVGAGSFYTDSGSANVYVLANIGSFKAPTDYVDGMEVRFRAGNPSAIASTVNAGGLGVKNIKLADGTTDISTEINIDEDTILRYDLGNDVFIFTALETSSAVGNNIIINPDFNIWQRGTSFVSIADGSYTADRFKYAKSGVMVHDITRSTDVPTVAEAGVLFNYSSLIDCTTADASIDAADFTIYEQYIEGFDWLALAQKPCTLSFWVKATKTGTYCVGLRNSGNDRFFIKEYTVDATDTWEFKTINIAASPSAGTWDYTNGIGLRIEWVIAAGSNFHATAGSWQTGNNFATSNQVNACDSTSNNFRMTGVKLETGAVATDFVYRPFEQELALCKRYYEKGYPYDIDPGSSGAINFMKRFWFSTGATLVNAISVDFTVEKVSVPSVIIYDADGNPGRVGNNAGTNILGSVLNISKLNFIGRNDGSDDNQLLFTYSADAEL